MSTDTETFTLIRRLPGGHRIFRTSGGRFAIADDSGRTPDQTDDGVLYVETRGVIRFANDAHYGSLPLVTPDGTATRTLASMADAMVLAAMLAMPIEADGVLYKAEPLT